MRICRTTGWLCLYHRLDFRFFRVSLTNRGKPRVGRSGRPHGHNVIQQPRYHSCNALYSTASEHKHISNARDMFPSLLITQTSWERGVSLLGDCAQSMVSGAHVEPCAMFVHVTFCNIMPRPIATYLHCARLLISRITWIVVMPESD